MGEKHFLLLSNSRDREQNPELVKGSGANHYPRAPSLQKWGERKSEIFFQRKERNNCDFQAGGGGGGELVSPYKHEAAKKNSFFFLNGLICCGLILISLIYLNVQVWVAVARHNFKWLKLTDMCSIGDETFANLYFKTIISIPISVI